jgi:hypothetical protein
MKWAHDPESRTLLVSENITNASKLGSRIRWHFESNALFRTLFPETLPDTSCTWTAHSLQVRLPKGSLGGSHGEGTFDFLGVGGALQSRHYNRAIIQDDLVGRKAIESQSIMDKTIEYHQLLPGAFEDEDRTHEGNELVIGNRWGYSDLNSHIQEHEPWFLHTRHSALGGCCGDHPDGTPIFPEEWSVEKLARRRERLGSYLFSCQYLNNPCAPEDADFKEEWLGSFKLEYPKHATSSTSPLDMKIIHSVKDGLVRSDIGVRSLALAMTVDPNHSGNAAQGRCRHAICVIGQSHDGHTYLLHTWAQASGYDEFYNEIFKIAMEWGIRKIGVETIAAQTYVAHHIKHLNSVKPWRLRIQELKGEVDAPDGGLSKKKEWRIRSIVAPMAEFGKLWVQKAKQMSFIDEYIRFPKGKFKDLLDAFAYAPQCLGTPMDPRHAMELLARNREQARKVGMPYSVSVN